MAKAIIDREGRDVHGMVTYLKISLHWEEGNVAIRQDHSGAAAVIKGSKKEKLSSRW